MKQLRSLIILFLGGINFSYAQITSDAIRFADTYSISTARSVGTGNALDALGADFSTLSINPAGLALYRSSEVTLSPIVDFNSTQTTFAEELTRDSRTSIALANLGLVFAHRANQEGLKYINIGLGVNRIASFNQDYRLSGITDGSRVVAFAEQAQGVTPDNLNPFESQLAYDTYLIDNDTTEDSYIGCLTDDDFTRKVQTVRESGGITELSMAVGVNYQNKLYAGLSLGVNFLRYRSTISYEEQDEAERTDFQELLFTENRRVLGTGANAKFGLIYRINHSLMASLSVQSPTLYGAKETYSTTMRGVIYYDNELQDNSFDSPQGSYPHRLTTPWRASLGFGAILGKKGGNKFAYIGLAGDYINYRLTSFDLKPLDTVGNTAANRAYIQDLNNNVYDLLQPAFRVRFGGGFVLQKVFQIRYGYQFQSSPYQNSIVGLSDLRHQISLGFGLRTRNFFLGLAYMNTIKEFESIPYTTESNVYPQQGAVKFSGGHLLMTVGVRFGGEANMQ